jgi:hypothetical protein
MMEEPGTMAPNGPIIAPADEKGVWSNGGTIIGQNNPTAWKEKFTIANLSIIDPTWISWDSIN